MIQAYELAVIGAGPAGLEAAITAAEAGVKTALIDDSPLPGGQYFKPLPAAFQTAHQTRTDAEREFLVGLLKGLPVTAHYHTLTWGIFKEEKGEGWLAALYGQDAPKQVHARTLVLANGAYDTPVAIPGWTLPGVMTAGAALTLLKTQRIAPARRALVVGTGPLLLSVAAHLIEAGVEVAAVCEANRFLPGGLRHALTALGQGHRLLEGANYLSVMMRGRTPYKLGWTVLAAHGADHVEEAVIARLDGNCTPLPGTEQMLKVDALVCGFNLTPNTGLARMIGCKLEYQPKKGGWVPERDETMQTSLPGVYAAGDSAGIGGEENARLEGRIAGAAVALQTGHITTRQAGEIYGRVQPDLAQQRRFGRLLGDLFTPGPGLLSLAQDDTLLCRCEEITLGEVKAAVAQGARTLGEVKMITRVGMGNCQGRMCERSVAGAIVRALAAEAATPESVGIYSIRPPLHPLPVGFLAEAALENEELPDENGPVKPA